MAGRQEVSRVTSALLTLRRFAIADVGDDFWVGECRWRILQRVTGGDGLM